MPKNTDITRIEITLSNGSKLVSIDSAHANEIYSWWQNLEVFASSSQLFYKGKPLIVETPTAL